MAFVDPIQRLQRQNAADTERVATLMAELQKRTESSPPASAFEALVSRDEEIAALKRKIVIAKGVERNSAQLLADALADRNAANAEKRNAEMQRQAKAAMKRVRAIFDLEQRLADELDWLREHVTEFERYNNDQRGDLPFVADAEFLVRQRAGEVVPARVVENDVWLDRAGNVVQPQIYDKGHARWVGNHAAVERGKVNQVLAEEYRLPATKPDRLTDSVKLVNLDGSQLWPPR